VKANESFNKGPLRKDTTMTAGRGGGALHNVALLPLLKI